MTIEELYNWALNNDCEDYEIYFDTESSYTDFDESDLNIDSKNEVVEISG